MKTNFRFFLLWLALPVFIFLQACDDGEDPLPATGFRGFFVVNEGGFGNSNTSLSIVNTDENSITNNIFLTANNRPLGDQAQSMTKYGGRGYVMVQNSGKVEVINTVNFTSLGTISERVQSPRYFVGVSDTKAYLSDWGSTGFDGSVKVIDLSTLQVTDSIATGQGANRMLLHNEFLYVTNNGGFGRDSTVTVIDRRTDTVVDQLVVGNNPNSLAHDAQGNVWVLAGGYLAFDANFNLVPEQSVPGSLSKLNPDGSEAFRLMLPEITFNGADNLQSSPDGLMLYFTYNGGLYRVPTTGNTLPASAFIEKDFYGLAIDQHSGGNIIGCIAPDFSSPGTVEVYDPTGNLLQSYEAGIAPNGITFR
mgnify:CR=1 FL=1